MSDIEKQGSISFVRGQTLANLQEVARRMKRIIEKGRKITLPPGNTKTSNSPYKKH